MKRGRSIRSTMKGKASLPGNGGRGLKLNDGYVVRFEPDGIAPRQRGAWIETAFRFLGAYRVTSHRSPATGGVD